MARRLSQSQVVIARAQVGAFFGALGGSALIFAVLAFVWQGRASTLVLAGLAVGALGLALWRALAPRDFVAFFRGQPARRSTGAAFSVMLLLGVVVMVYILALRANTLLDMTQAGRFSLSGASVRVLRQLDRPAQITGFYSAQNVAARDLDTLFFRLYEEASGGLVRVALLDPAQQPALAQRFGVQADGDVFVSLLNDDGTVAFGSVLPVIRSPRQERDITTALGRLLVTRVFTVAFAEGRNALSALDGGARGLLALNDTLKRQGLTTAGYTLGTPVPVNVSALVLARPASDLSEAEVAPLADYLARGGALLVLADVPFGDAPFLAEDGPLAALLREGFGLVAPSAIVVDPASSLQTPLDVLPAVTFVEPPIGQNLPEQPPLLRLVRPIEALADKPASVANGRILMTTPNAWGETDLRGVFEADRYAFDVTTDLPGPLALAAWAQDTTSNGRVVLVGDSDFITNGLVQATNETNLALAVQSLLWMSGFSETIQFGFQNVAQGLPLIFVSTRTLDAIALVTMGLLPLAVLMAGALVWWRRARR